MRRKFQKLKSVISFQNYYDNADDTRTFFLIELLKHFLAASIEEKRIVDAINKQKNEVNRQQEEVMNLLDRILEEIEKCPVGR